MPIISNFTKHDKIFVTPSILFYKQPLFFIYLHCNNILTKECLLWMKKKTLHVDISMTHLNNC